MNISENEIRFVFVRASGPGGQNVNKVASAAQLRFNVMKSLSLSNEIRERLLSVAKKQITRDGVLIIEARRFRTQEANRHDAIERLVKLIHKSVQKPKIRRNTKPTRTSKMLRLEAKHRRTRVKRLRRPISGTDE